MGLINNKAKVKIDILKMILGRITAKESCIRESSIGRNICPSPSFLVTGRRIWHPQDPLPGKVNFGYIGFSMKKVKTFSGSFEAYDLKVGRC